MIIQGRHYQVAAIVPCHNEEIAIAQVVDDLHRSVPGITVYVYDNCSTDGTAAAAARAGATVRHEPLKGKGNVVRRAFADIDADVYLMIDGDDTYDAAAAPRLIETLVTQHLDHVVGVRRDVLGEAGQSSYRSGHAVGNKILNGITSAIFGDTLGDMLSGYRVFSRRFIKSFPAVSREFEIETELTVHSLALRIPSASVPVDFKDRPAGSESKLRTYHDGWRILKVILGLARHERPLAFFGLPGLGALLVAVGLMVPVLVGYWSEHTVDRMPTMLGACILVVVGLLMVASGLLLDGIRKSRHELSRLSYLQLAAVGSGDNLAEHRPLPVQLPSMRHPRDPSSTLTWTDDDVAVMSVVPQSRRAGGDLR